MRPASGRERPGAPAGRPTRRRRRWSRRPRCRAGSRWRRRCCWCSPTVSAGVSGAGVSASRRARSGSPTPRRRGAGSADPSAAHAATVTSNPIATERRGTRSATKGGGTASHALSDAVGRRSGSLTMLPVTRRPTCDTRALPSLVLLLPLDRMVAPVRADADPAVVPLGRCPVDAADNSSIGRRCGSRATEPPDRVRRSAAAEPSGGAAEVDMSNTQVSSHPGWGSSRRPE